jgi:hypothetical protein
MGKSDEEMREEIERILCTPNKPPSYIDVDNVKRDYPKRIWDNHFIGRCFQK